MSENDGCKEANIQSLLVYVSGDWWLSYKWGFRVTKNKTTTFILRNRGSSSKEQLGHLSMSVKPFTIWATVRENYYSMRWSNKAKYVFHIGMSPDDLVLLGGLKQDDRKTVVGKRRENEWNFEHRLWTASHIVSAGSYYIILTMEPFFFISARL